MQTSLQSTLMHVIELVAVFGAAFGILYFFGVESDFVQVAMGIALGALAKFSRASDAIPVDDYVNR